MKDQLKITSAKTLAELGVPQTAFLSGLPGGWLVWFESIEVRQAAIETITAVDPSAVCECIEHETPEPVESDKAVVDVVEEDTELEEIPDGE